MKTRRLNTGVSIPAIGFGTWEIPNSETAEAVATALKTGYRLIDTAKLYGNEQGVGKAVRESGIPREEIFVTTKLWNDEHDYGSALKAFDASLTRLGLDYIDLYLIHWPATRRRGEAWKALTELHRAGKAKAIGVSNYTIEHLRQLMSESDIVPAVNQVEFHPYIYDQQKELLEFCKQHGIVVEAYSPLARVSSDYRPEITNIANRLGKTEQQVFLRWCIQRGTVPLPRSQNPEHIEDNFDVFDFELCDEDMEELNIVSDGIRVTWDPAGMGA